MVITDINFEMLTSATDIISRKKRGTALYFLSIKRLIYIDDLLLARSRDPPPSKV